MPGHGTLVVQQPDDASPKATATGSNFKRFMRDCTAGTLGGLVVVLVGHPFDTVKVRLQTQSSKNPVYSGVVDCVSKTWQAEGVRGLYKGVSSPIIGQMFFRAIHFAAYGQARSLYAYEETDGRPHVLTTGELFKAGAVAGFFAAFAEGPIELYKSQLQVQTVRAQQTAGYVPPFTTLGGAVKRSFQLNGWRAPFQGLGITILRDVPANAAYFGSFELLKRTAAPYVGTTSDRLPLPVLMLCGGTAGSLFWIATFPLDVIKSAIQADSLKGSERQYQGIVDATKTLWADGGVPRFFRGFAPCMIRAIPANAAMLSTVSSIQDFLARREAAA